MTDLWRRCLERLEAEFSVEDLHTWLAPLQATEDAEGLRVLAPNAYTLDVVRERFQPRIAAVLQHLNGAPVTLRFDVGTLNRPTANPRKPAHNGAAARVGRGANESDSFESNLDPNYTFDLFRISMDIDAVNQYLTG